jgi:16S rRNA (cytidine1402-2'-O)-methyltransferase
VSTGELYIVPAPLGESGAPNVLSDRVLATVRALDRFIAEDPKTARAFLKSVGMPQPLAQISIDTLNEHTPLAQIPELLSPLLNGARIGLLSEAGYPAIADPGAELIAAAHAQGVRVVPLVGPSSLLLALAASGLNGQSFCFHGYLPVPEPARRAAIMELESRSRREAATQMFIETPYRNNQMLKTLLNTCERHTLLCIATDLTLPGETVRTQTVEHWKSAVPDLNRRPSVFLLQAARSSISAPYDKTQHAAGPRRSRYRSDARSARRYFPSE